MKQRNEAPFIPEAVFLAYAIWICPSASLSGEVTGWAPNQLL